MLLKIIFSFIILSLIFKLIKLALKATWGIMKVLLYIVCFPAILVALACYGFIVLAIVLGIAGFIFSLFAK